MSSARSSLRKKLLGHVEERLGKVGTAPDFPKTILGLPMLQYQTASIWI